MARPIIATESKFLAYERDRLINFIKHFTNISLTTVFGDPLRYYILSFNLEGYKPTANGIVTDKPHTIQIYLPPEYPETPPQITALTPLYHPEVNPATARIDVSARWAASESPSLAKVVNLLAHMITGRLYKTAEPADPEALAWYEEHASSLPLDQPVRADLSTPSEEELEREPYAAQILLIQDMLKRNQLFIAARELESLPPDLHFPERGMVESRVRNVQNDAQRMFDWIQRLAEIRELVAANRIYALAGRMANLPPLWFPERADIVAGIAHAKSVCDRFFTLAQEYEKRKAYGKALSCGLAILQHIPDHPDAQQLIARMQQHTTEPVSLDGEVDAEGNPLAAYFNEKQSLFQLFRGLFTAISARGEGDFPWKRILVIGAMALAFVLLGMSGAMFIKERAALDLARTGINSARSLMSGMRYTAAQKQLESTRDNLPELRLLTSKREPLIREIEAILASPELKDGILVEQLTEELTRDAVDYMLAYYPAYRADNLTAPAVSFLRREGARRIFEISCLGKLNLRSTRLVLRLSHDEPTGAWKVLTE